jgi:drug/metabolite transporter (DMT)-like permease
MKQALIRLHTAIFLAGFTAILGKLISLGTISLVWWRLFITVVFLAIWLRGKLKDASYPASLKWQVMGVGALVGLHWLSFFGSVKWANVSIALVCFSSSGFFSALLEPMILKKRISWFELMLGILSMAGIYIIFHFDARYKVGIGLGVLCAALSALFSILNKKLVTKIRGLHMTAYEMAGALAIVSLAVPFNLLSGNAFWPVQFDWLWLGILSVLCTVWAFVLQLQALKHISAFTLNLSYNLEPVYGILLAFVLFRENEHLNKAFYFGALLIIFALGVQMVTLNLKRRKSSAQELTPTNSVPTV